MCFHGSCSTEVPQRQWFVVHKRRLNEFKQTIRHSSVGGHHSNGIAERNISTVLLIARAMLHHQAIHWPCWYHFHIKPCPTEYNTFRLEFERRRPWPTRSFVATKLTIAKINNIYSPKKHGNTITPAQMPWSGSDQYLF